MKYLILAAIALIGLACSSHSQTIKSLGYDTTNGRVIYGGTNTLTFTNAATFSTNVTVNGNLSVGSLTTTTPSTWALDATQTAAATNGILALPSNANVIRLTNNNAISSVTNGVLGAFYFVVNQATNAVTISNVGGITVDGAQNLTLSPNESATLVATGATNASVAARGDLNNVTLTGDTVLSGVNNTMPNATNAASASSLMTRELSDSRYFGFSGLQFNPVQYSLAAVGTTNGGGVAAGRGNVRFTSSITNGSGGALIFIDNKQSLQTQGQHTAYKGYGIYACGPNLLSNTDTVFGMFYGSMLSSGMSSFEPLSTNGYSVQWRNNGTNQLRYVYKNGTNEVSGPWTSLPAASSSVLEVAALNTTNGFRVLYRRLEGLGTPNWTVLTNVTVTWTWASTNSAGSAFSGISFIRTNTTSTNAQIYDAGTFGSIIGGENL